MQTILDRAIESYRRTRFLEAVNRTYADLRADAAAWRIELEERNEWDGTTRDLEDR